jgi:hypothetical protein
MRGRPDARCERIRGPGRPPGRRYATAAARLRRHDDAAITRRARALPRDRDDCSSCATKIKAAAGRIPGVLSVEVSIVSQTVTLHVEDARDRCLQSSVT